jgi:pimeloyl-ACP methyl ester carboxylesterase
MRLEWDDVGSGKPVLCLHGFGMDRSVMAAALEPAFRPRSGLRRIYLDLPGHGESPAGPPTSAAVIDAISGFCAERLGGEPPLLAGWSYGGYIAMALAGRPGAAVAGLLLICPGVKARPEDRELPGEPTRPPADGWLDRVPQDLRAHLSRALGNRTPRVAERVAGLLAAARPGDRPYQQELRTRSYGYRLPGEDSPIRYDGPASFITGRQDRVVGYADQFRALPAYPRAGFAVVANAGHYLPFEQPAEFASLVAAWLDSCLPGA